MPHGLHASASGSFLQPLPAMPHGLHASASGPFLQHSVICARSPWASATQHSSSLVALHGPHNWPLHLSHASSKEWHVIWSRCTVIFACSAETSADESATALITS